MSIFFDELQCPRSCHVATAMSKTELAIGESCLVMSSEHQPGAIGLQQLAQPRINSSPLNLLYLQRIHQRVPWSVRSRLRGTNAIVFPTMRPQHESHRGCLSIRRGQWSR
jgi:hypothetical protein